MILFDPSEDRDRTRLPQKLRGKGKPLPGLEQLTGADLLVTKGDFTLPSVSKDLPTPLLDIFKSACETGALIQRKSGRDLVSSVDDFDRILLKMLEWSGNVWLLTTGIFTSKDGVCRINRQDTEKGYLAVRAAITHWQLKGGYYIDLCKDSEILPWVLSWERRWFDRDDSKIVLREPKQKLTWADEWERLTVIPGVGVEVAKSVWEWLPEELRSVANCLEYLSNERNYESKNHPRLVGPSHFRNTRAWLQVKDTHVMREVER